jgi:hypothetical protein
LNLGVASRKRVSQNGELRIQSEGSTMATATVAEEPKLDPREYLVLRVHGRVLEHLGIQMYESPVNAIAELVSNAWDADAENVTITLPERLEYGTEVVFKDDGIGMTPQECQDRYLYVGNNRRGNDPTARSDLKKRHVLGRKGIGKFAGFGIASVMRVETISQKTGERTVFELRLDSIMGEEYIGKGGKTIKVLEYEGEDEERKKKHGTTITLYELKIERKVRSDFPKSMARRFMLLQRQSGFTVMINGAPLPDGIEFDKLQYIFPRDYIAADRPEALLAPSAEESSQGWGTEKVGDQTIRWRFMFHRETIEEEELRGITVFANGKLVQAPFLFHLSGGLRGQHGLEYLTGQIEADYLDQMKDDVVTTERQRINWEHPQAAPLLEWGKHRIKNILQLWSDKRGETRRKQIEDKMANFSDRLERLPESERRTIRQALVKLGGIATLSDAEFSTLGTAILTAWEQGRLKTLIGEIAASADISSDKLLALFTEMDVLTALNVAEAVKTRLMAVGELQRRVNDRQLENTVRDYISLHPYLLAPEYETFKVEQSLNKFLVEMNIKGEMPDGAARKRVDLVMVSGQQLVLFEFMRPGLKIDWNHISRYELYFRTIVENLAANTGGQFTSFTGYVVADEIEAKSVVTKKIQDMRSQNMFALDWQTLVRIAFKRYEEHFDALISRNPDDPRLKALAEMRPPKA